MAERRRGTMAVDVDVEVNLKMMDERPGKMQRDGKQQGLFERELPLLSSQGIFFRTEKQC